MSLVLIGPSTETENLIVSPCCCMIPEDFKPYVDNNLPVFVNRILPHLYLALPSGKSGALP